MGASGAAESSVFWRKNEMRLRLTKFAKPQAADSPCSPPNCKRSSGLPQKSFGVTVAADGLRQHAAPCSSSSRRDR